jgi:DNA-binding SARP family transcriptional activator
VAADSVISRGVELEAPSLLPTREHGISFGLLGPLEVLVDGRALELGRRKQRSLLALLLLHAGAVVSRDWLIEELWYENPPKAAVSSLQNLVSDLRKVLGREVVHTHAAGYALEVQPDCVDVHRFERLVAAARDSDSLAERAHLRREALALWRGPPLTDFASEPFAQIEIVRLEELRTAAREELIDAELELGNHGRVVGELELLVAQHPLRERLRVQLMLALYRSGRQTEALDVYQDARRTLTDELGLEPGEELQQLERAILNHDPLLRPSGSVSLAVGDAMEFRVLGPLEVEAEEELLRLGRTQQRALLAFLLLHPNEVVSREELIIAVWGEHRPNTAATALHGYVSGLRKSLGADRIETRSPGYVLHAASGEIDLLTFEGLLAEARSLEPAGAAARLDEALKLWRGRPLADLDAVPFVPVERLRLDELYLSAVEERNEANLELGKDSELIGELQTLVHEHPLRERLRGQLMLALYRSGRQAEALDVYQQGRHLLAEELGLEPGEALKRLELAILEQDPALDGAATPALRRNGVASPRLPTTARAGKRVRRLVDRPLIAAALGVIVLAAVATAIGIALARRSDGGVTVVPNSVAIVDAKTGGLVGDIPVDEGPVAVAFGEGALWVANADDGTVSRIDPKTWKVVGSIRAGNDLRNLATGFGAVWTADGNEGTVTRIDRDLSKVTKLDFSSEREDYPPPVRWIATGAGAVWATRGTTLFEIDPATNEIVARISINPATGLAAGLGYAWVVTDDQRLLQVAPGAKARAITKHELGDDALAPTVGGGSLWLLLGKGRREIWRVDPGSAPVKTAHTAGRLPLDLAVAERGDTVWVVDSTGAVLQINPNIDLAIGKTQVTSTIPSALAAGGGAIWVAVPE